MANRRPPSPGRKIEELSERSCEAILEDAKNIVGDQPTYGSFDPVLPT